MWAMLRSCAVAAVIWPLVTAIHPGDGVVATPIDPLTIDDDDFARHRNPATWVGLRVSRIVFREERAHWRLFRIADPARPRGPLWVVPHDNENAAFEAALVGLRAYGGVVIAVDSGDSGEFDGNRRNRAVAFGRPIDPNRNFHDALPRFRTIVLADHHRGARPIVALHTNAPGFDPAGSRCNRGDPPGRGEVSIRFCDEVMRPHPSQGRAWPFDDDDTLALVAHRAGSHPFAAFCGRALALADFNLVFERVAVSDGSLSNHALLHGMDYINFETRERGLAPAELAQARNRLVAMIDRAMARCAAPTARIDPPRR